MVFDHVFSEIQEYDFFKLVGSIVNNMERINTGERNKINSSVFEVL